MVQNSYNQGILEYRHISKAADEIVDYIKSRYSGETKSLITPWPKFNATCMGGIEPNTIYTVAGISGSGKSSFINTLESELFELNPNTDFCVLSFNYEMLSSRQVGRKLSAKLKKTTSQLYSGAHDFKLTDKDLECIENSAKSIARQEIYYVDTPGTVEEMERTIMYFLKTVAKGKWLLVSLDHTLLTRGSGGETERTILANLEKMLMRVKKSKEYDPEVTGDVTIIQLSQMNRNIEDKDRISNRSLQFPIRSDIFGGDSIFQASDYVLIIHRPEVLGITTYGPNNLATAGLIYLHFLKNREGSQGVIQFKNNLKFNRIENV